jgi:ankyrin repeat protein
MSAGARLKSQNRYGDSILHVAVQFRRHAILRRLVKLNMDTCIQNMAGNTPLHLAASLGDVTSCEILLFGNAAINCPNNDGNTPLHLSLFHSQLKVAEFLLLRGIRSSYPFLYLSLFLCSICVSSYCPSLYF